MIGEPVVAYFAKALVTDSWPLKKPVTAEVMDPDDLNARIKKTFTKFVMDDETRRWTAGILAESPFPYRVAVAIQCDQKAVDAVRVQVAGVGVADDAAPTRCHLA